MICTPGAGTPGAGTVGVATLVAGRRDHLARLLEGLALQDRAPDRVVVVCMDDDPVVHPGVPVVRVPSVGGQLPLATARNAGVAALGTDAVILLDVDCIPGRGLICGYAAALAGDARDGLVCGQVRYLPAGEPGPGPLEESRLFALSLPHPARPLPEPGELVRRDLHALAWTTSLALRRTTFDALGGFDERFCGYGGEDTDFGERARLAEVGVWWSGDAVAFHQHHGESGPPVQHLDAIVRNARLFNELHGWWPMQGWLEDFLARGLIRFDPAVGLLERL